MNHVVFLFPGQGSQFVGMGRSFFDARASVRQLFEEGSDVTGRDLKRICFEGPESDLSPTDVVQPAITVVNLAVLQVLVEHGISPKAVAGHSLGEYAALCAAGVFTVSETLRLVQARGAAMKEAAERHPGGMIAVFGLSPEVLGDVCREASGAGSVEVANHNSPLQVALTGETPALQQAGALAKARGAKLVVPIKVSGAWHSRFMAESQSRMREVLAECRPAAPRFPVIANLTADVYPAAPQAIRETLIEQLVRPVRWVDSMSRLIVPGAVFIEAGPGKVLMGLMRDTSRETKVMNVQDEEGLAKLQAFAAQAN